MEKTTTQFPFYARLAFVLISLIAIFFVLSLARGIVVPVLMALLFSILLRPVANFLHTKLRFPNVLASLFSVVMMIIVVASILFFISWEISDFTKDWDTIQKNLSIHGNNIQTYVREKFNVTETEQKEYLNNATQNSLESGKKIVGTTLMSFTDTIMSSTLVPVYTFLFLLYRTHFLKFLHKLVSDKNRATLQAILCQVKVAVQSYLMGLITQMVTVSTLTAIGLTIVGVDYAILLGVITGLLNLIPYIGILVACLISIFATLTGSPDLSLILGVIIVTIVVQLIDNNILVPIVVSSKVEINAFVSIVGIIIGGNLGGIAGMFLAIPLIAILKVIFDRIPSLEPWGYLMGDDLPKTFEWQKIKLPLYGTSTTTVSTVIPPPVFTDTTLPEKPEESENKKE